MRTAWLEADASASDIRSLVAQPASVAEIVSNIIEEVESEGDAALRRMTAEFDGVQLDPDELRVRERQIENALDRLDSTVREALETAVANVAAVASAQAHHSEPVVLPEGQVIEVAEIPVRRAGIYVPGGRAPYPSSVVMCATVASRAGVSDLAVCTPPGPSGQVHSLVLGACALCGVDEVYPVGGAQAIAALALGTDSIAAADVIVGPGNAYVTEAKRQLAGRVGIDGLAGPSELVVVAAGEAEPELIALDLMAQAEHGPGTLVVLISDAGALLDVVASKIELLAPGRPTVSDAQLVLVRSADIPAALALANDLAPEHLELVGAEAESMADHVRTAGCLFLGRDGATAFGDYVAGSNHVLPTGGAARFTGGLSLATFRRRMARVSLPSGAAARLAPPGATLARAEGFPVHGESMERRA